MKTIKTIKYSSKVSGRNIAYSVLFTRLSAAIITKTGRHLAADFDSSGVDLFVCSLIDREAFKSVFSFGGTVNVGLLNPQGQFGRPQCLNVLYL
jgi:chromosome partitioning protein